MPSATLRLSVDPTTGKRTVTIAYGSELDALPHEHEEAHRELVDKIFEKGIAKPGDNIVIEREGTGTGTSGATGDGADVAAEEATAERERVRGGT